MAKLPNWLKWPLRPKRPNRPKWPKCQIRRNKQKGQKGQIGHTAKKQEELKWPKKIENSPKLYKLMSFPKWLNLPNFYRCPKKSEWPKRLN